MNAGERHGVERWMGGGAKGVTYERRRRRRRSVTRNKRGEKFVQRENGRETKEERKATRKKWKE